MLILHTSDWHLGRTLHGADMSADTQHFLDWLVELVKKRHVDVVLISGDVHDRAVASIAGIRQLSQTLNRLCDTSTVILTSGNHDSAWRLGANADLYRPQLHVVTDPRRVGTSIDVHGSDGTTAVIYPIPYLDPDLTREILSDQVDQDGQAIPLERSHQAVVAAALRRVRQDLSDRRDQGFSGAAIAMVHAFVSGAAVADSEHDISVGGVSSVSASLFDSLGADDQATLDHGLDYVACGHLHRPQKVSGAHVPIRYSGSPVAYSFSEADQPKSVTLLEATQRGVGTIEVVPIPQLHHLRVLTGTLEQVLEPGFADPADWLSVTLVDQVAPPNYRALLQERYPHVLFSQVMPAERQLVSTPAVDHSKPTAQLIEEFFVQAGGRALDAQEKLALQSVIEQAQRLVLA